jgi:hypothetical protein
MPTDPPNFTGPADTTESVEPTAELAHLHPDNLRLGGTGVFAGDWAWTDGPDGSSRIAVGFVGVLIDTFFRTTKIVDIAAGLSDTRRHPHLADVTASRGLDSSVVPSDPRRARKPHCDCRSDTTRHGAPGDPRLVARQGGPSETGFRPTRARRCTVKPSPCRRNLLCYHRYWQRRDRDRRVVHEFAALRTVGFTTPDGLSGG